MSFQIRRAGLADFAVLAEIYLQVRRETLVWVSPEKFALADFAEHSRGESIWLAQMDGGEVMGFISLWDADHFIHMLYIRQLFQNRGVGVALLRALPHWPMPAYRLKCLIQNVRARAFYRAQGFVVVGQGASPEGDFEELLLTPHVLDNV